MTGELLIKANQVETGAFQLLEHATGVTSAPEAEDGLAKLQI
jgi:hypothetical protein